MQIPLWLRDNDNVFLLVALLLCMWLLLISQRKEEMKEPPKRISPVSADELGRAAFVAILRNDIFQWRELFINGGEARTIFNDLAPAYMEKRSHDFLKMSLQRLHDEMGNGGYYVGLDKSDKKTLAIVYTIGEKKNTMKVGTVTLVGPIWRLLTPSDSN
jgi:hypothetical protein